MKQSVVEQIKAAGGEAAPNYDNVATVEGGESILETALGAFGQVDVLINNAGVLVETRERTEDGFELTFAVNSLAPFLLTRLLWPRLVASGDGRVVNAPGGCALHRARRHCYTVQQLADGSSLGYGGSPADCQGQ